MSSDRPRDHLQQYIPQQLLAKLEAARTGAGGVQGERRVVTVLFCDVRGSTALAEGLDPEEWAEIINGAFEHLIAPVYRYEGTLARLTGDGILSFFGAPLAHEDDPERAVLAGLEIIQGIQGYREQVRRRWGLVFDVRVGLNTGLVVVGEVGSDLRVEYTALGDAVNVAARMEQAAEPGTVQIAEATYRLVADHFEVESLGEVEVKGKAAPVPAYRVLRARPGRSATHGPGALSSPLVGRERELRTLRERVGELLAGSGQVASVIGEAGLGKSRLVAELRQALADEGLLAREGAPAGEAATAGPLPALRWLEGRALSYEALTPYAVFAALLGGHLGLVGEQSEAARYARLAAQVTAVAPGRAADLAPHLAALLGVAVPGEDAGRVRHLEPQELRERVFAAVADYLAALAGERPLVLVIEDLHWADPASLDLLERLLALTDEAPLMLLLVFRPQRQEPSWRVHEAAARDYPHRYTAVELAPLDEGAARELVGNLLRVGGLPEEPARLILERAEGNPFFVEEVTRALLDAGAIARREGRWVATGEAARLRLPDTLAGVLAARLDRLDDETRRVAQTAAVVGREFPHALLAEVYGADGGGDAGAAVERALRELQRRELVRERGRLPERAYRFKHVLTQEAAYGSLLLSRRRVLHRCVAEALERGAPERAEELARHYWEAGEYGRALPHLVEAGDRAARAYAPRIAVERYSRALEAAGRLGTPAPPALHRARGLAHDTLGDFDAARADHEAALALARESGDRRAEWQALVDLGALWASRDYARTGEFLRQAADLAPALGDPPARARSLNRLGNWLANVGRAEEALALHREALAIFEARGDAQGTAEALDLLGMASSLAGDAAGAVETYGRAIALFRQMGDRQGLLSSLVMRANSAQPGEAATEVSALGTYEGCARDFAEALALARQLGWPAAQALAEAAAGGAYASFGDLEAGLAHAREGLRLASAIGHQQWIVAATGTLGQIHLALLAPEAAIGQLEAALELARRLGSDYWVGVWSTYLALAYLLGGDLPRAEGVLAGLPRDRPPRGASERRMAWARGELALARGEPEAALAMAEGLLASAPGAASGQPIPRLLKLKGEALLALGRLDEAGRALEGALRGARERGERPLEWQVRRALGQVHRLAGREDRARREVRAAREVVAALAATLDDARLREQFLGAALAMLPARRPRSPRRAKR